MKKQNLQEIQKKYQYMFFLRCLVRIKKQKKKLSFSSDDTFTKN